MHNTYTDEASYIDNDTAKQLSPEYKKIWDEMFVCLGEIENIFCAKYSFDKTDLANREKVAAYLLFKISSYNNPFSIKFNDLEHIDIDIDLDIFHLAEKYNLDEFWTELTGLIAQHEPKIFLLVSGLQYESDSQFASSFWSTPDSLSELAEKVLNIQPSENFVDICCGTGTATVAIKTAVPDVNASGYDISSEAIALAKIHNFFSGKEISFFTKDVFDLVLDTNPPIFDKIFSNYPFGTKFRDLRAGKDYLKELENRIPAMSKATSSDWLYNSLLVDLLSETGKAVGIMTTGSTWNMIDAPIRKYFAEKGLIEAVIALPAKLFGPMSISTSMIIFSHGNTITRLVDATGLYQAGRRINELTEDNVNAIVEALKKDSEISMALSIEDLRENDYVLNTSRYSVAVESIKNGDRFETVIKRITRGAPLNAKQLDEISSSVPTDMQYLMLANVKNGLIDTDLPYISKIDSKNERYCLSDHCLILSKNGYPYKVAVAEIKEGRKILANGNLYVIELDETKVNPYYLAAFFSGEQGIAALKSITVGATIPNIGVEQLKKLIIPLPPLERQKEIAKEYQSIKDEILMLQLKIDKARNRMMHIIEEEGGK